MQRRAKRAMPFGAALVTVIALIALLAFSSAEPDIEGIVDFYATSREVSKSELVQVANKLDVTPLYLPSELPPGFKLTAIYLKEGPFIAMVVYSAEGNKDYKTAELVIEIAPTEMEMVPTYEQLRTWAEVSVYKKALEINGWPVKVNERASTGGDEKHVAKYGDYQLLVEAWIEGIGYTISPMTLTPDEAIQLVQSMKSIS